MACWYKRFRVRNAPKVYEIKLSCTSKKSRSGNCCQKAKEEELIKKLSELANAQSDYAATQEYIAVKDQDFEAMREEVKRLSELAKCERSVFEESEKRCVKNQKFCYTTKKQKRSLHQLMPEISLLGTSLTVRIRYLRVWGAQAHVWQRRQRWLQLRLYELWVLVSTAKRSLRPNKSQTSLFSIAVQSPF